MRPTIYEIIARIILFPLWIFLWPMMMKNKKKTNYFPSAWTPKEKRPDWHTVNVIAICRKTGATLTDARTSYDISGSNMHEMNSGIENVQSFGIGKIVVNAPLDAEWGDFDWQAVDPIPAKTFRLKIANRWDD